MFAPDNLLWCGNDVTVLEYIDQVIMVGPGNKRLELELGAQKTSGIKCLTEIDGLRIINSDGTYFLENVQEQVIETFKAAATTPGAKLLNAIKSVDFKRGDEMIRKLNKKHLMIRLIVHVLVDYIWLTNLQR